MVFRSRLSLTVTRLQALGALVLPPSRPPWPVGWLQRLTTRLFHLHCREVKARHHSRICLALQPSLLTYRYAARPFLGFCLFSSPGVEVVIGGLHVFRSSVCYPACVPSATLLVLPRAIPGRLIPASLRLAPLENLFRKLYSFGSLSLSFSHSLRVFCL